MRWWEILVKHGKEYGAGYEVRFESLGGQGIQTFRTEEEMVEFLEQVSGHVISIKDVICVYDKAPDLP